MASSVWLFHSRRKASNRFHGRGNSTPGVPVFALFAYTGVFLWSITFISLGYFLGDHWTLVSRRREGGVFRSVSVIIRMYRDFIIF